MEKNERIASSQLKSTITEHIKIMRWKNPHPKRAVNARTVLKVAKEEPLVLCLRILGRGG